MTVELREHWNVSEHSQNQKVVEIKGNVQGVWQVERVFGSGLQRLQEHDGLVDAEELAGNAERVEDNEEGVAAPGEEVAVLVENVEGVPQVAGDLGDGPDHAADHGSDTVATLRMRETGKM